MKNFGFLITVIFFLSFLISESRCGIQRENDFNPALDSANITSVAEAVNATLVLDEAEAALNILEKKKNGSAVTGADWDKLFSSEGYIRLKKREASMNRAFEDSSFAAFILSDKTVEAAPSLSATLTAWKNTDVIAAARRALNYLPQGAAIKAKIYPVIKPKTNSFVFEVDTDPAIFLYLNPDVTQEQFENTLTHELHHIGYGSCCPNKAVEEEINKLSQPVKTIVNWTGAFGEGFAMLAAAGGPDVHPHAVSPADERERWDNDMKNFNSDLKKVEEFFLDILHERLKTENEINEKGFSFFGIQGPWYTVGWKMSAVIEKTFGKAVLLNCMCDMRTLLKTYNEAAAKHNKTIEEPLALWSEEIINITE
ncbi:MAG TPA: DUF5700 domain-containing putative Zn-dependent protease [Ignavibacteriales bacterium]|nr:DUF5700 domain-containing putative Zn-dependent protease [Ignavibacteriales bacterium]